ncbi:acetylglutamate kinase [Moorella thermoacetica]|uniref:Acetylglutamate kinase n=2 Tax=Neomoorella thermoacetica TaxID=1525 RepID=ARGB_MOOTA|nr:acetylglutamate kinase [Moorella thermoacetica]Q2RG64.1 RecName: Full=Acetylglutamate kinase; AltName: Full=N-acetyl-L-glutamate 5-phosphotransferase; AltName: Full=NAG kinase; Short=NAGK [Moorella thermoacetica ATCC 39073]AKX95141.1 acetylglutamate kinase [Moorella thermoacetica]AKX97766.1 acetylglutamate kinase [Moorella thermoacetica]OIQ09946.1 acetylglutamate kinase [Moorella thermoacetica]OIQ10666.1 acetylglutamate kinase [Moorella thermoacetica]OIQ56597.1 acetylglutamate kinase [Moor
MTLSPLEKTGILIEALPYIRQFYGKTVVIKYGGHAMVNCELKKAVMQDAVLMHLVGMRPVIVHGGGPEITSMLGRLGKQSQFIQGQRVTDAETMEIVEMVLVGKINKEIVANIHRYGGKAIGLCGKDGHLIEARKQVAHIQKDGEEMDLDLGYVGQVERVNPGIIETVIAEGYIPVVAPIGVGPEGESYNINADLVAGELAVALQADKLVLLTDVEGILADRDDPASLISSLEVGRVPELIQQGVIAGGMIPKVNCCIRALEGGVKKTHIIDGRIPHSILLEVFTDTGVGTMVVPG